MPISRHAALFAAPGNVLIRTELLPLLGDLCDALAIAAEVYNLRQFRLTDVREVNGRLRIKYKGGNRQIGYLVESVECWKSDTVRTVGSNLSSAA